MWWTTPPKRDDKFYCTRSALAPLKRAQTFHLRAFAFACKSALAADSNPAWPPKRTTFRRAHSLISCSIYVYTHLSKYRMRVKYVYVYVCVLLPPGVAGEEEMKKTRSLFSKPPAARPAGSSHTQFEFWVSCEAACWRVYRDAVQHHPSLMETLN